MIAWAAVDRPCRPVEGGEETVTSGVTLVAAKARQLAPHD